MNYSGIIKTDIANGTGVRVSLFVSGCPNHCPGCFNQKTWDENYGRLFTEETENRILNLLKRDYIAGLSILGGEPMTKDHQRCLLSLVKRVKEMYPQKDIWIFSGYTWEELHDDKVVHIDITREILNHVSYLVDGRFVESLKDTSLRFRGSSNQRIIDVQSTLKSHYVIQ